MFAVLLSLLTAAGARAQVTGFGPFEIPGLAAGHVDVAFDPSSRPAPAFLVVSGNGAITGRFVRPDGTLDGSPFQINTAGASARTPAVAYNPDNETFLVVWIDSRESAAPNVWGRVLGRGQDGTPRFLTPDTRLSNPGSAASPDAFRTALAYSTASHEFLVAWRSLSDNQIYAHHVSNQGIPTGADVPVSPDATAAYDHPAVAYNRYTDSFLVGYGGASAAETFVEARWVRAGTGGAAAGPALRVSTGSQQRFGDVVFSPAAAKMLLFFADEDAALAPIFVQRFAPSGSLDGAAFPVWRPGSIYRGLTASYNPVSSTFAMVAHGGAAVDTIIELQGDGTPAPGGPLSVGRASSAGSRVASSNSSWLVAASDATTVWGEIAHTATTGVPIQPFAKVSPLNGATNHSFASFHVALNWVGATPAPLGYRFCIDTTNDDGCDFSSGGWQAADSNPMWPIHNLQPATTYYWQVGASLPDGTWVVADDGAWWSFTTQPGPFAKLTPASGTANLPASVTLTWQTVPGASSYEYCVRSVTQCTAWQSSGLESSAVINDLAPGFYLWQVRAIVDGAAIEFDADKDFSPVPFSFTVGPPPGTDFKKTAPVSSTTVSSPDVVLRWDAGGFYRYDVCLNPANDGTCAIQLVGGNSGLLVTGLAPGTYYWKVTGWQIINARGTLVPYPADGGTWWSFTVPPPTFAKVSPARNATGLTGAVTMTWGSAGAAAYDLCVSANGPACDGSLGTWRPLAGATSTAIRLGGGTYYWQVRATTESATIQADGGTWARFTVAPPPGAWYTFDGDGAWPAVIVDPVSRQAPAGAIVWFTASASGTPGPAVLWQVSSDGGISFANIPSAATPTYAFVASLADDGKQFRAVFANASGGAITAAATLSVIGTPSAGAVGDLDGDFRTDLVVWRPTDGMWHVAQSSTAYTTGTSTPFGSRVAGDVPLMGEFDGDGRRDYVTWRASTGEWFWRISSTNYSSGHTRRWGGTGDVPLLADFDGDRLADITVWRPSTGEWFWLKSSTNYTIGDTRRWGGEGDVPLLADFDGDGRADITVWRPSTGDWFWLESTNNWFAADSRRWGGQGDQPLLGDFDGDGRADITVFRQSTGQWFWVTSGSGYTTGFVTTWGGQGDQPLLADFDGDGRADITVWRRSTGQWFWLTSTSRFTAGFGRAWGSESVGDVPVVK